MTDEFALRKASERASRAQALLEDEMLSEAFAALEAYYIERWKSTAGIGPEGRERLWSAVNIVGKVRSHLDSIVSGGKLARRELDEIAAKPKRFGVI